MRDILWCRYVTDKDLEFFKERVEAPGELKGAGLWEHMMYKDFGSFTYEAWRRSLAVRMLSLSEAHAIGAERMHTALLLACCACPGASCVMQALAVRT